MGAHDPRFDPESANVVRHDYNMPFAHRTVSTFFWFLLALAGVIALAWWYFTSPQERDQGEGEQAVIVQQEDMQLSENPALPLSPEGVVQNHEGDVPQSIGGPSQEQLNGKLPPMPQDPLARSEAGANNNGPAAEGGGFIGLFSSLFGGNGPSLEGADQFNMGTAAGTGGSLFATGGAGKAGTMLSVQQFARNAEQTLGEYENSFRQVVGSAATNAQGDVLGTVHDMFVHPTSGEMQAVIIKDSGGYYGDDLFLVAAENILTQNPEGGVRIDIGGREELPADFAFIYGREAERRWVSLRYLYDGQVLDVDSNVAGQIHDVIYENAKVQRLVFVLEGGLSPSTQRPQVFIVPYEELKMVRNTDGFDAQLSRAQTVDMARQLIPANAASAVNGNDEGRATGLPAGAGN